MADPWRFRPIQSPLCPICSTSHFPFCPPPPPFINHHHHHHPPPPLPPPTLHHPPSINHRTVHNFPPPPQPHYPNWFVAGDEFPDRKRMRVEDPNPSRFSFDDERRLSLIREHGRQEPAQSFENHRSFQERRDSYGQRSENEGIFSRDRTVYGNESSSYGLPNHGQYSQHGSYEIMPRMVKSELENPKFGVHFEEIRRPYEPYESNGCRMDSAMMGRAHYSQMYPPLPPQPPLPLPPEPSPPPMQHVSPMMSVPPHMQSPVPTMVSTPLFPTQRSSDSRPLAQSRYYNEMYNQNPAGFDSEV